MSRRQKRAVRCEKKAADMVERQTILGCWKITVVQFTPNCIHHIRLVQRKFLNIEVELLPKSGFGDWTWNQRTFGQSTLNIPGTLDHHTRLTPSFSGFDCHAGLRGTVACWRK
jgi:hypothetical protein